MTAVEWMVNELNNQKCWADPARIEIIVQQALELEKEQHEETFEAGYGVLYTSFEQFYLETHKTQ
jgi:hypothetical protein